MKGDIIIFTIPEKRLLSDSYFLLIYSDDTYYEIMSKKTSHLWIIKKGINSNKLINIYHKHSANIPYYHKQKSVNTVKMAIEAIKSHDDYVINKQGY